MKNSIIILVFALLGFHAIAQEGGNKLKSSGMFSLGGRSTVSAFNDGKWQDPGYGVGGQFRIQLNDRVNTEWFFDYISGDIGDFAYRTDYHIGWSVLFYLLNPQVSTKFQPYILSGHCFDYTRQTDNSNRDNFGKRWSSAVQAGLGTHYHISPRFDLSLTAQYMVHLGTHLHAHLEGDQVVIHNKNGGSALEGHFLFTLSFNYKIANLW